MLEFQFERNFVYKQYTKNLLRSCYITNDFSKYVSTEEDVGQLEIEMNQLKSDQATSGTQSLNFALNLTELVLGSQKVGLALVLEQGSRPVSLTVSSKLASMKLRPPMCCRTL